MSEGKHISLEEALKKGKIKRFAREHESKGDRVQFEKLLDRMAKGKKPKSK